MARSRGPSGPPDWADLKVGSYVDLETALKIRRYVL